MKAKAVLIAVFCILSLAGCQNSADEVSTSANTTSAVQNSESTETTSAGEVTENEAVQNNTEQSAAADSTDGQRLTLEEAKAAALEHAGVNESEVTNVKTEFDYKDGVNVIEVEFDTSSYEYEYEINADDGHIIKVSKEAVLWQTPQEAISAEDAENIALEHAGLSRDDVTFIKTEHETDDNREKYEIEFIYGGKEYEYDISAGGDIIKFEIDEIND